MEDQITDKTDLSSSDWEHQWQLLMGSGNSMAQRQQWESAAIFYKKAFVLAENNLCNQCPALHCDRSLLNTYLSSALELGKAIKNNTYECAFLALIDSLEIQSTKVNCEMEYNMYSKTINQLKSSLVSSNSASG
ncbi:hypothetical protein L3Q72_17605 [Vibrio sp. JC009]|uniref:hypothetical protein n=1 Tax=Vibrio sp. JC009 TaxID=2912314 RepID=UPI0023B1A20B|nr:hypothetical protein [Vibrio sp. JC009]WED24692.1 hypothetical protein L3Q72_17605 [Vibrio sp. JC009]